MSGSGNTLASTHSAQSAMRADPSAAIKKCGFIVTSGVTQNTTLA
jgi:hydroxymethylpyrimidine/phosphomethylpyrimidine kinase